MIINFFTKEKLLALIVSIFFSILTWFITNALIIEIALWQYFFIEILLLLLNYFYTFVMQKLHLPRAE
jgi:hypothetical protein